MRFQYHDLRDFLTLLEKKQWLKKIDLPIRPQLEMTEICDRTLKQGDPLYFFKIRRALKFLYWVIFLAPLSGWH